MRFEMIHESDVFWFIHRKPGVLNCDEKAFGTSMNNFRKSYFLESGKHHLLMSDPDYIVEPPWLIALGYADSAELVIKKKL